MGLKKFKPVTPSLRWTEISDFSEITKDHPEKKLLAPLRKTGGRNNYGRLTSYNIGGGHKRMYRIIDFRRDRLDVAAKVLAIEYDPNRSSRIALLEYPDSQRSYIVAPLGLGVGDEITSTKGSNAEIKTGNCMPLRYIPLGTFIHNIELKEGEGAQMVRSAGNSAQIMAKEGDFAHIRLPSAEVRLVKLDCRAVIGQVGNIDHEAMSIGKAGRNRWLGIRPGVRGSAMNPIDHPHGGGEGKAGQGNPHPVSPWGMPTKGYKTRKKKKFSERFIIKHRR
ncbi:MAG: 50S ribosomal protein L2 [Candidatus Omnitrophica bacterium]|nr:50S ribosomal protein L2 [Candidatus Omnitrophota bacterium]MDD5352204.1 50S ribosomal protein L2 [Candidatus Omnitrophota bacterium]MDD5549802.1 50S ribosomal protein L2 [Candidatus Omnitrophota bacterium]